MLGFLQGDGDATFLAATDTALAFANDVATKLAATGTAAHYDAVYATDRFKTQLRLLAVAMVDECVRPAANASFAVAPQDTTSSDSRNSKDNTSGPPKDDTGRQSRQPSYIEHAALEDTSMETE